MNTCNECRGSEVCVACDGDDDGCPECCGSGLCPGCSDHADAIEGSAAGAHEREQERAAYLAMDEADEDAREGRKAAMYDADEAWQRELNTNAAANAWRDSLGAR